MWAFYEILWNPHCYCVTNAGNFITCKNNVFSLITNCGSLKEADANMKDFWKIWVRLWMDDLSFEYIWIAFLYIRKRPKNLDRKLTNAGTIKTSFSAIKLLCSVKKQTWPCVFPDFNKKKISIFTLCSQKW